MSRHIFEIGDDAGNSFRVSVEVPFNRDSNGSWRTLNKGYIRYNSGKTKNRSKYGGEDDDLLFFSKEDTWGLRIDDYQDYWGLNDDGTGVLLQAWVLSMNPGTISWSLID